MGHLLLTKKDFSLNRPRNRKIHFQLEIPRRKSDENCVFPVEKDVLEDAKVRAARDRVAGKALRTHSRTLAVNY